MCGWSEGPREPGERHRSRRFVSKAWRVIVSGRGRPLRPGRPSRPLRPSPPIGKPVDNFAKSVENLLKTSACEDGEKAGFQSGSGVIFRDTPYLRSRHGVSRDEIRRVAQWREAGNFSTKGCHRRPPGFTEPRWRQPGRGKCRASNPSGCGACRRGRRRGWRLPVARSPLPQSGQAKRRCRRRNPQRR